MKYLEEFRNLKLAKKISAKIVAIAPQRPVNIMEVCGTHTQSFCSFGLAKLIPSSLRLISGPGCPVCVSSQAYIDAAITLAKKNDTVIATFGDMLRIPGTRSSLEKERARGARIEIVYSAAQALKLARLYPEKKTVFLAVGFETTAPTIALTILAAKKEKIKNLFFYSSLKLIPPAMDFLVRDKRLNLSGFLCPGHVCAIIGTRPYEFLPKKYGISCCVSGFEPLDILEGLYVLLRQIKQGRPRVENEYMRVVTAQGNLAAQKIMKKVFWPHDACWRGLGRIARSGLKIKNEFSSFDAEKVFNLKLTTNDQRPTTRCRCGDILKGLTTPPGCPLFARACSPDNPIGPCMVSSEGACNAYYRNR